MKKVFYLMLTLLLLSVAGANAQVTIGTGEIFLESHPGAILDLESVEQIPYKGKGLLLPVVNLTNINSFGLSGGNEDDAAGMVVYNTDSTMADGIYLWMKELGQAGKWVIIAAVTE
jgi:hypothetical protein